VKFVADGQAVALRAGPRASEDYEAVSQAAAARLHSGPVVAATLAPILGFFTLMASHHVSRLSSGLDKLVHAYGYWIPGSVGSGPGGSIGSYSGKETLALAAWGLSWLLLHFLWRNQDFSLRRWLPVFCGALALVTLGFFHPLADPLVLGLAGLFGLP
jgi:hypothetical protein